MKLDVYVNQALVGTLEQVEVNRFVFAYQANVTSSQAVSLLMPVRLESWVHAALHPVFQVSLPEGEAELSTPDGDAWADRVVGSVRARLQKSAEAGCVCCGRRRRF